MKMKRLVAVLMLSSASFASAGPLKITARTNPQKIRAGASATIAVRVSENGQPVASSGIAPEVVDGHECGTVLVKSRDVDGTTTVVFTGDGNVENCVATIKLTANVPQGGGGNAKAETAETETRVIVNPDTPAKIDGIGVVALVLIVSFAIDRLVHGLFFLLSYSDAWARAFPDPELNGTAGSARVDRNRKLAYFIVAAIMALVAVLYGRIRILGSLGSPNVNSVLDSLVSVLILTGGADRAGQLLASAGGSGPHAAPPQPTPIEISGRLTLEERGGTAAKIGPGD